MHEFWYGGATHYSSTRLVTAIVATACSQHVSSAFTNCIFYINILDSYTLSET